MPLFKVFPRFGAMISQSAARAGEAIRSSAHVVGWIYHFSNGITFGVMYVALIGQPVRRSWWWGVLLATGIEMALLLLALRKFFGIQVTALFVAVTLAAHLIFGARDGLEHARHVARWQSRNSPRAFAPQPCITFACVFRLYSRSKPC
jgi:hypothetical protein